MTINSKTDIPTLIRALQEAARDPTKLDRFEASQLFTVAALKMQDAFDAGAEAARNAHETG